MAPMATPGSTLGVVAANDTLWSLASNNRPDASITVQQMMLALLRANPDAFGDGNINILKRGAVLRMPDNDELTALSRSEALAEVQRQHQIWSGYRDTVTETIAEAPLPGPAETSPEPMPEEAPAPTAEAVADETDDARLELVAPGSDDDQMGAGDGDTGSADVTLTREELDAQVQANSELQARIAEADEIIDLMRRQVDIKDDELAALQARLAELGIDAPADLTAGTTGPDEEMMSDEMDAPGADEQDDAEVAPDAIDEVDISIGDTDESVTEDAELAGTSDDTGGEVSMDDGGGDDASGSLLGGLIPAHIANMVPGGAMTVLGVLGAIVLALIVGLMKLLGGRRDDEAAPAAGIATAADDVTALTEIADDDEPITETRDGDLDATVSADQETVEAEAFDGDVPPELQATSPDLQATIESSAEELARGAAPPEPEDDPLEEVNVYLAYERFDQAEELVRKVIADHPDDHKYKLRLLEVYYSSNNKHAYEQAAGELRDAVGEDDPLWESAVAMWTEMSPDRALFEEGADTDDDDGPGEAAGRGFVDITAAADDAGAKTMSMAPGTDFVLESTQVGLPPLADDESDGGLDFDLGAAADAEAEPEAEAEAEGEDDGGMLDLTGGMEESADDEVFDLTASADTLDFSLDAEPADTDAPADDADVLDIGSDTSDLTAAGDSLLDVTAPDLDDGHDLLDVTKTGDLASGESDDILNVTSPGLMSSDEPEAPAADDDILDISGDGAAIDFDISDTVAPAFDAQEEASAGTPDDDAVFDITSSAPATAADDEADELDFDIGSLGDDDVTAEFEPSLGDTDTGDTDTLDITGGTDTLDITGGTDTLDITGGADADAEIEADARSMLEDSLDLDIPDVAEDSIDTVEMEAPSLEAPRGDSDIEGAPGDTDTMPLEARAEAGAAADFDLSLQGSELDELSIGADTVGGDGETSADDEESEIEFDLALQDTTEMDSLVIDDTLELPKSREPDETLDDLTKSMEESMAELEIDDDELELGDDDGELDLSLADTTNSLDLELGGAGDLDEDVPSLDFDIDDLDIEDLDQADTVAMDLSSTTSPASEETVIMPVDESVERQSEADEIDTKLNLAKAYIELGDNDGARSILDEVARDGSDAQQTEAQRLIDQLS
jgi:pilus assembly protein FimV